jgi:hypothetical protein
VEVAGAEGRSPMAAFAQQTHELVLAARDLVAAMDADTRSKSMSSGTVIGWIRAEGLSEHQFAASRILESDATSLGERGLEELRSLIRAMIHEHRARRQRDTYREALAAGRPRREADTDQTFTDVRRREVGLHPHAAVCRRARVGVGCLGCAGADSVSESGQGREGGA